MTEPSDPLPLTRESVCNARERTRGHVHLTPVLTSQTLNNIISTAQTPEALKGTPWEGQEAAKPTFRFFFKCENFQKIGAFKIRGASHALSRLSKEELQRGVLTTSSGHSPSFLLPIKIIMNLSCPLNLPRDPPASLTSLPSIRQPRPSPRPSRDPLPHHRPHSHAQHLHALKDRRHKSPWPAGLLQREHRARAHGCRARSPKPHKCCVHPPF